LVYNAFMESKSPRYVEIIEALIAEAEARGENRVVIPEDSGKKIVRLIAMQEWARNPKCPFLVEAKDIIQGEQPVGVTSLQSLAKRGEELNSLNVLVDNAQEHLPKIEERLAKFRNGEPFQEITGR
jgi:hypothetical protein